MLKNLLYKNLLIIQCTQKNKIKVIILINTYITKFDFMNKKFVKIICKKLDI